MFPFSPTNTDLPSTKTTISSAGLRAFMFAAQPPSVEPLALRVPRTSPDTALPTGIALPSDASSVPVPSEYVTSLPRSSVSVFGR